MLGVHLVEDFGEILTVDDLCVLNLEEILASVTVHVYEDLQLLIGLEAP